MFSGLPDPDPLVRDTDPDPATECGSFYHQAKIVLKNYDSYCFVTFFDFLSLKNDVNVASKKVISKKT